LKLINFSILILAPENAALGPGCRETQREAESLRHYRATSFYRLAEVKKPRERISIDQHEEISFLRLLGVPARIIRLIER
jgi:hypothetical protein